MNKEEFASKLRKQLSGMPKQELDERISFYCEMINDRIEDGLSEQEAVNAIGSVESIANQILTDTPLLKLAKEKLLPKRKLTTLEIILLVLGAPIWFSILITLFSIGFSIFISLWAIIISLWATEVSLIACGITAIIISAIQLFSAKLVSAVAILGAGFVSLGISILLYYGCKIACKIATSITKFITLEIKKLFIKKEEY